MITDTISPEPGYPPGTDQFRSLPSEKREKIFDAAVKEFASKGYHNASMNCLVKQAGISKGSLFQYFKTKRLLFDSVVEIAISRVKQYLKGVRGSTSEMCFFDRLDRLIRAGFDFIDQHPMMARIYFHLLHTAEQPFSSEIMPAIRRQSVEFLGELLNEAVRRGELRPDVDADRTALLLNGILETMLRSYYTENFDSGLGLYKCSDEKLEVWVRTAVQFVQSGLQNTFGSHANTSCGKDR